MNRVVVSRPVMGLCHMQVCAAEDATDEEILDVCNRENISGTSGGWQMVIRENAEVPEDSLWPIEKMKPVACEDHAERKHYIVAC